jgi:hypothetical protein
MKLRDLNYHNWHDYYAHLYDYLDNYPLHCWHLTTAEVLIHSALGLPRNQIREILATKFPNKKFNPQYVKSTANKYKEIITELRETIS